MSGFEASAVSSPGFGTTLDQAGSTLVSGPMLFEGLTLYVGLAVAGAALVPLLAAVLRRGLPVGRRPTQPLEPVSFGSSQKARRSPRHAILQHRGLVGNFFMALVALFLFPAVASLTTLGAAAIPAAIAFVLPTLLVTIHARRRATRP